MDPSPHQLVEPVPPEVLQAIEQHLHGLIRDRVSEFRGAVIDKPLPRLQALFGSEREDEDWFPVRGMYGGFKMAFERGGNDAVLVCSHWSRVVGGSGQRHLIDRHGVRLIESGFV